MAKPFLIIVQGAPASGKTTLINYLKDNYDIGYLAKDSIKETFFDSIGAPKDRDVSRIYGRAAMDALFAASSELLKNNISHVLEAAFHPSFAIHDIANLIKGLDITVVQIYCYADADVCLKRYQERVVNKARHAGHLDKLNQKTVDSFREYNIFYSELPIQNTIRVDTGSVSDYSEVYKKLRDFII